MMDSLIGGGGERNQASSGTGVIKINLSVVAKTALYYNKGDNLC